MDCNGTGHLHKRQVSPVVSYTCPSCGNDRWNWCPRLRKCADCC